MLAVGPAEQMDLGTGQIDRGRHERESVDPGHRAHHLGEPGPAYEDVVQRRLDAVGIEAEREREAGLRIKIDHQDPVALLGHRHPDRLHGGRLGDTALLVGERHHFDHRAIVGPSLRSGPRGGRLPAPTLLSGRRTPRRPRRAPGCPGRCSRRRGDTPTAGPRLSVTVGRGSPGCRCRRHLQPRGPRGRLALRRVETGEAHPRCGHGDARHLGAGGQEVGLQRPAPAREGHRVDTGHLLTGLRGSARTGCSPRARAARRGRSGGGVDPKVE